MTNNFLICETKIEAAKKVASGLEGLGFTCDIVSNGKEAQLKLYKQKYRVIILDISIKNHSSIEVLRYIKVNCPQTKIVLISDTKMVLDEIGLSEEELGRLHITSIVRPYNETSVLNTLNQKLKMSSWVSIFDFRCNISGTQG